MGLRAVIFDCDGVLADTEPLHFRVFNRVLEALGITITPTEYATEYLGLADREAFSRALTLHDLDLSREQIERLVIAKARAFTTVLSAECRIYPGVVPFVRSLDGLSRAVASGARREEIEIVLRHAALAGAFTVIIGAEDVAAGKPDPTPFRTALAGLNRTGTSIAPEDCLVVEDSTIGLVAARRAGMRCLAVTNSYPAAKLTSADLVVSSLEEVSLADVFRLFG